MEVFKYNAERVNKINRFMKKLLELTDSNEKVILFKEYEKDIEALTPLDIFYLDFYANDTELSIEEIKESANKFVNVFHKGIFKHSSLGDHPLFKQLLKENKDIQNHLSLIKPYYKRGEILNHKEELKQIFISCNNFEIKFNKYQNIIFPHLEEKVPSTKPLEVLWELHDDSKLLLKNILSLLDTSDEDELIKQIGKYHYLIFGIGQKEEIILLPVLKALVSEEELDKIYNECLEIGFVFNDEKLEPLSSEAKDNIRGFFTSKTGKMSIDQLIKMLNHLPLDITFVDKEDTVLYYNESKNRHFPRTPAVIGRKVKNCHPPKSVDVVEGIISDFKNNVKDFEEFWINFKGKTLYIAYYAVRDELNNYLGVLEVSQDISHFQEIKGEKRLRDL